MSRTAESFMLCSVYGVFENNVAFSDACRAVAPWGRAGLRGLLPVYSVSENAISHGARPIRRRTSARAGRYVGAETARQNGTPASPSPASPGTRSVPPVEMHKGAPMQRYARVRYSGGAAEKKTPGQNLPRRCASNARKLFVRPVCRSGWPRQPSHRAMRAAEG